jgi:DNA primase small subunit
MTTRDIATKHALSKYYSNNFPVHVIWKWLQTSSKPENREFSFCEDNHPYNRYNSFANVNELHSFIIERIPQRIDIGPVYNIAPHKKSKQPNQRQLAQNDNFRAELAEFKIDIDIPDYNDARLCHCKEKETICNDCWPLINLAIVVLSDILENDFAYERQIWFFSGKKGAHGWVCDERTLRMDDEKRGYITNFLQIFKRNTPLKKRDRQNNMIFNPILDLHMLHPTFKRVYKTYLLPFFEAKMKRNIGVMLMKGFYEGISNIVMNSEVATKLLEIARAVHKTDEEKWSDIKCAIQGCCKTPQECETVIMRIVFWFTYPRVDENVSKPTNHLLKSPFVIHPETLRVCIPITTSACIKVINQNGVERLFDDFFDPSKAPVLTDHIVKGSMDDKSNIFYEGVHILEQFISGK